MTTSTQTVLTPSTVKVGDGVTERIGSDRRAGTVTYVSPSGKTLRFTHDNSVMRPGSDYYGNQDYDYTSTEVVHSVDWEGKDVTNERSARWSDRLGVFIVSGTRSAVRSGRNTYSDPSF